MVYAIILAIISICLAAVALVLHIKVSKALKTTKAVQANSTVNGEDYEDNLKTVRKRIYKLTRSKRVLAVTFIAALIIAAILIIWAIRMLFNTSSLISSTISTVQIVLNKDEEPVETNSQSDTWSFGEGDSDWSIYGDDDLNSGDGGSSGLYPVDVRLKKWAQLIEVYDNSCAEVTAYKSLYITANPQYMLGTMLRETGADICRLMNNDSSYNDVYQDLMVALWPICGKQNCVYIRKGHSHYYGGKIVGSRDAGDPYTQMANDSEELYNSMIKSSSGGHAVGLVQYECKYIYSTWFTRLYGESEKAITQYGNEKNVMAGAVMDSGLGFIRPNILYMPDVIFNYVYGTSGTPRKGSSSGFDSIMASNEFKAMNERNQQFIMFYYADRAYNSGSIDSNDDAIVRKLMSLVTSGEVDYIDNMADDIANEVWSSSELEFKRSMKFIAEHVNKKYGMGMDFSNNQKAWSSVAAAMLGNIAYNSITAAVELAEKSSGYESQMPVTHTADNTGESIANTAFTKVGAEYTNTTGGKAPKGQRTGPKSYDCSGLVYACLKEAAPQVANQFSNGKGGAGSAASQAKACEYNGWTISFAELQPGDLIFYYKVACRNGKACGDTGTRCVRYSNVHHVGIYVGNGKMVDASSGQGKIVYRNIWREKGNDWCVYLYARPR